MIRPLRQCHRRIVIGLGICLPTAFTIGITLRQPVPLVAEWPASLATSMPTSNAGGWPPAGFFAKSPVLVRWLYGRDHAGSFALEFSAARDFLKPDLLVYWAAGHPLITNTLPDKAVLLGAFAASPLPLSPNLATNTGVLVLYSLADGEIVDVSQPVCFHER